LLLIKLGIQNLLEKNKAGDQCIDVKSTIDILDNTIVEAKQIARDIKPVNLEELGLSASLAFMSKKVARESRMLLHLEMPEENVRFDPEIENCIYRVTQESLTNIIKHSKATEFTLNLQKDEESIALIIADNGIGFKPKMLLNKKYISDGMGLMNMQERVERLDGKFYIDSSHNNGTVITIEFPGESLSYE
jgi:signal transduction histidine kinase